MIRTVMLALAVLVLGACSQKYPDYEDFDTEPYFSDLRDSFQRPPAARMSYRSLDSAAGATPSPATPSRAASPLVVRPQPRTTAPTPLVPAGG